MVIQKMMTEIRKFKFILMRRFLINFYISFLKSIVAHTTESVVEVRPFRYRENFCSNEMVRPGPRTDLTPRLRNGVR